MKYLKNIAQIFLIYIGSVFIFKSIYMYYNLNRLGFVHPGLYNKENTFVLFISGIIWILLINFIFHKRFSFSKTYFYILFFSSVVIAIQKDVIVSYFTQSTPDGGILAILANICLIIVYPLIGIFYYIYKLNLFSYVFILIFLFFVGLRVVTFFIDKYLLKVNCLLENTKFSRK